MEIIETEHLILKPISETEAETILPVYLNSADYLDTQTPDEPSTYRPRPTLTPEARP